MAGRVYVAARTSQRDGEQDPVYLCSHRTRRRKALGFDDCFNADQVGLTRFVGRFLAVSSLTCGPGGYESSLDLRRVADGKLLRSPVASPELKRNFDLGALSGVDVTDLVARSDGALAWIVSVRNPQGAPEGTTRLQVRSSTSGTGSDLLADGEDIAPRSLALAGSTLYWTQGAAPRSAALP